MSDRETLKPCHACGAMVSAPDGQDHSDGQFLCPACSTVGEPAPPALSRVDSPRRCTFCDRFIPRKDCHRNRYGEYVCLECNKKGLRWSSRRRFFKFAKKLLRWGLFALIGVCLASAYLWFMLKVIHFVSQPPPPNND